MSRMLLVLLGKNFVSTDLRVLDLDDTMERYWGRKISSKIFSLVGPNAQAQPTRLSQKLKEQSPSDLQ